MKKFIFITLLCTMVSNNIMLSMKRLPEDSLESLCTKKIYVYHSPQKQTNFFERSYSDLNREMNLWGSPRKDLTNTEDYDISCVSLNIPENTELEYDYDEILPRSSFSIAFEKIMTSATITNSKDIESEEDFFQPTSDFTKKAIALSLPTQIHTNTKNTKSITNTDTETESETATEEEGEEIEPAQTKTITKFFCKNICNYKECNKVFTSQDYLDKHIKPIPGIAKPYTCAFKKCGEKFPKQQDAIQHYIETHNQPTYINKQYYICTTASCNRSFLTEEQLHAHMNMHICNPTAPLTFAYGEYCTCVVCNQSGTLCWLKEHIKAHHEPIYTPKSYACMVENCSKSFKSKKGLDVHMRTHTGERPYACPFEGCNKTFNVYRDVISHRQTHTGEKPFNCPLCDKKFRHQTGLNAHANEHAGNKPYTCTIKGCDKSFSDRSNRNRHSKKCNPFDFYSCTVEGCNATYTRKYDLGKHIQAHATNKSVKKREKPIKKSFACTFDGCNESFRFKSNLKTHIKTHPSIKKVYACTVKGCNKTCTNPANLKRHMQAHGSKELNKKYDQSINTQKENSYADTDYNQTFTNNEHNTEHAMFTFNAPNENSDEQSYLYDYDSYVNIQREIFKMAHPEKDEDEFEVYIPNNDAPIDYQDYESNLVYK